MEILKGIWMDPVTNSTSILQSISASLSLWMAARLVWDIWRKWWYSVQIWWFIGDLKKYTKTMMKESFSSREHKRCEINHSNSEYQIHDVSNCRLDRNFLTCIEYAVWFTVHNPLLWTQIMFQVIKNQNYNLTAWKRESFLSSESHFWQTKV